MNVFFHEIMMCPGGRKTKKQKYTSKLQLKNWPQICKKSTVQNLMIPQLAQKIFLKNVSAARKNFWLRRFSSKFHTLHINHSSHVPSSAIVVQMNSSIPIKRTIGSAQTQKYSEQYDKISKLDFQIFNLFSNRPCGHNVI